MTNQSHFVALLAATLITQPIPALPRGGFGNADPP